MDSFMPIERTFQDLSTQLRKLHDTFLALRLTVVEDKPLKGDAALVDQLEDSILDQMGLLDEGRKAAEGALKAVGHPLDLSRARLALTICQERFHGIEQQFTADLVSYEKLKDLASLGARGGEWRMWANSVKQGIEQCRQPLDDASKALAACWQEIAERVGMTSISVQATNIGQKIVTEAAEAKDMVGEGIT
ncbi:MAG: hypothetical protein DMG22_18240 [Acidobacteria bacterium]|nr:MAG: hypothetical protein DMG22_18240 [Acidobacteriota bacterium]